MKNKTKIIVTLVILLFLLGALLWGQFTAAQTEQGMRDALHDELRLTINEKGQQEASIAVLTAQREAALLNVRTKDTIVQWLQATVKDYNGALNTAIVHSSNSGSKGITQTIILKDTVRLPGRNGIVEVEVQNNYETRWSNKWEEGYILAKPDSIFRDIKVKNEYEITLGAVKNKLFKPKEYEVKIVNLNPNTKTKELRSFQVKAKPKRVSLGLQVGYGFLVGDIKPRPYIGLGAQFNLLALK